MSEEEWLRCSDTNAMFKAIEVPTDDNLAAFNLACCRRIRGLITDDLTLQALDALEHAQGQATVPADLALAANQVDAGSAYFNPASALAARAVGHAVCRSLPPGSLYYWTDGVDNARLVALHCQCAVGHAADAGTDDEDCYDEADEAEPGVEWLRKRAEQNEASAQCDLMRSIFNRRVE